MPIQSGTHLGPYEILSPIGAGGMGEIYRARPKKIPIKGMPAILFRESPQLGYEITPVSSMI
jgi:eukaryotic-like serine/threonine-protein kinase